MERRSPLWAFSLLAALGIWLAGSISDALAAPPSATVSLLPGVFLPSGPDLFFFQKYLAKDIHKKCASCHSDPESGGRFFLVPLEDLTRPDRQRVLKNYRATLAFLDADDPANSAILRKSVGADAHGGGELLRTEGTGTFARLLHFAMGATLDNRPPESILPRNVKVTAGARADLDGALSADPDGSPISFHWTIAERPPGSTATINADDLGAAQLTPDREGPYRVELRVHDGRLWSLPTSMLVVASPAAPKEMPKSVTKKSDAVGRMNGGMNGGMGGATMPTKKKPFLQRRIRTDRVRLIRRVYLDLKWRTPRFDEIERWYDVPHEEMVATFLQEPEVWGAWYEQQLYYFLLLNQFRPKIGRVTTLPVRLAKREVPVPIALREVIASTYFNARNPGNDTFCTVVLEQCMGMVVQERKNLRTLAESKKMYDGYQGKIFKEKGSSQSDFVRICFSRPAFFEHLLRRTWKDLHDSEISPERLKTDAARFGEDPWAFHDILHEWLVGPEYVTGAKTARTKREIPYVRGLFMDSLGRVPTYEELRNVRNAFLSLADPTPIRLVMGRVLLESDEASMPVSALESRKFVQEQFLRLFARAPSNRELTTFVEALQNDPDVTPRVILWTLISSPEYQTY